MIQCGGTACETCTWRLFVASEVLAKDLLLHLGRLRQLADHGTRNREFLALEVQVAVHVALLVAPQALRSARV